MDLETVILDRFSADHADDLLGGGSPAGSAGRNELRLAVE